jgi:hypothetical protein
VTARRTDFFLLRGQRFDIRAPRRGRIIDGTRALDRAREKGTGSEQFLALFSLIELFLADEDALSRWRDVRDDETNPLPLYKYVEIAEWLVADAARVKECASAPEEWRRKFQARLLRRTVPPAARRCLPTRSRAARRAPRGRRVVRRIAGSRDGPARQSDEPHEPDLAEALA